MKERWLKFDCAQVDLDDLLVACSWRVDPIRTKILDLDEDIKKLNIVNVNKIKLPPDISKKIEDIRKYDESEADIAIREIVYGAMLLNIPGEIHKEVRNILEVTFDDTEEKGFTTENISDLLEQMKKNKKQIDDLSRSRIIEKPIKEVFQQAVVPRLDNLTLGQREISSKMATKDDLSKLNSMDKKLDDIANILKK